MEMATTQETISVSNPANVGNQSGKQKVSLSKLSKNISAQRAAILGSGMIMSYLLVAYSFLFLVTYMSLGNTTSYFPWAWNVFYDSVGPMQDMFFASVAVSLAGVVGCTLGLWYVIPSLKGAVARSKVPA
jgi:hypothetical protein